MAGRVVSHRRNWQAGFRAELTRRTRAAAILLNSRVKANISQAGTLRYSPLTKRGKASKSQKTIYNFAHSAPGNPPYKQTGHLRRSIAWEVLQRPGIIGRVGTNLKYGRYLELGTKRLKARPYLRPGLRDATPAIRAIMLKRFPAGGLISPRSNQYRSGILGRGARQAGF